MNRRSFLTLVPATVGAVALVKPNVKPEVRAKVPWVPCNVETVNGTDPGPAWREEYLNWADTLEVTCFGDTARTYSVGKR